ncbi:MAG: glycine cleavage system aminomethyltransferase GcvT [Pseudomonadota bacterium]|nr:glycine cleavage system aminomethyltransferase GcvT [Pseudomonadota bacterium]
MSATDLLKTPLHDLHLELGARMVPFAGYSMPVQYPAGLMSEHLHCRASAALFDVSHMGQLKITGDTAAAALELLIPIDVIGMAPGQQRYGFFTDDHGGILDDLMLTHNRPGDRSEWLLIVNASNKDADTAHLQARIGQRCTVQPRPDLALLALQGPQAVTALARLNPAVAALGFMTGAAVTLNGAPCFATRSGYTGEDGFEISVPAAQAEALARALLAQPEVRPAGLGARDTLRLEAGLCLHGNDIDTATTPIEAGLMWAIQKVRRSGGARAGGYPGSAVIDAQIASGTTRRRVGLVGLDRAPVRPGTAIVDAGGASLGIVTSGTLAPTANRPIAIAYLPNDHLAIDHEVYAEVRGKRLPMRVTALPFVPHRYVRTPAR